ncbi:Cyclin-like domain-containing protein [Strongyloides ratti]|uniref:Cyclin-like domain-containing protein n=1 Tax=Strongyloides ratti TaxID=34506 RepID=A0A090LFY8_STRRB|nr:Cyclin-like domain-containing protein [Strongyloides ratti]CEF67063.1 Cyclin-like domain-containing protein [Strongyloides ratti]
MMKHRSNIVSNDKSSHEIFNNNLNSTSEKDCEDKLLTAKRIGCFVILEIKSRLNQSRHTNHFKIKNCHVCYAIDYFYRFVSEHGVELFDIVAVATLSLYYALKQKTNKVKLMEFVYLYLFIRYPDIAFEGEVWLNYSQPTRELFLFIENVLIKTIGFNSDIIDNNTTGLLFFQITRELKLPEKIFIRACFFFGEFIYFTNLDRKFDSATIAATSIELALKHRNEGRTDFIQFRDSLANAESYALKLLSKDDEFFSVLIKECSNEFINIIENLKYDKKFVNFVTGRFECMKKNRIWMDFCFRPEVM